MLDQATAWGKQVMAELRGEQLLTTRKLHQLTIELARILEEHGHPPKYNESYNCLRLALGKEYFKEWLGFTLEEDAFAHVDWEQLKQKYSSDFRPSRVMTWLRSRLPR